MYTSYYVSRCMQCTYIVQYTVCSSTLSNPSTVQQLPCSNLQSATVFKNRSVQNLVRGIDILNTRPIITQCTLYTVQAAILKGHLQSIRYPYWLNYCFERVRCNLPSCAYKVYITNSCQQSLPLQRKKHGEMQGSQGNGKWWVDYNNPILALSCLVV